MNHLEKKYKSCAIFGTYHTKKLFIVHPFLKFKFKSAHVLVDNPSCYGILAVRISRETHLDSTVEQNPALTWAALPHCYCSQALEQGLGEFHRKAPAWPQLPRIPVMGTQPTHGKCKYNWSESAHFHIGSLGTRTELSYHLSSDCSTFLNRISHMLLLLLKNEKH